MFKMFATKVYNFFTLLKFSPHAMSAAMMYDFSVLVLKSLAFLLQRQVYQILSDISIACSPICSQTWFPNVFRAATLASPISVTRELDMSGGRGDLTVVTAIASPRVTLSAKERLFQIWSVIVRLVIS